MSLCICKKIDTTFSLAQKQIEIVRNNHVHGVLFFAEILKLVYNQLGLVLKERVKKGKEEEEETKHITIYLQSFKI